MSDERISSRCCVPSPRTATGHGRRLKLARALSKGGALTRNAKERLGLGAEVLDSGFLPPYLAKEASPKSSRSFR